MNTLSTNVLGEKESIIIPFDNYGGGEHDMYRLI